MEKLQEIAGKSHEKDSLYKQIEARIEEICKNLEYKTYKDASEEQQRLSDEIESEFVRLSSIDVQLRTSEHHRCTATYV